MKLLLLFLFIINVNIYSQETKKVYTVETVDDYQWNDNRIGFTYSMMSGYGLSYLREINNIIAVKTQIFAYGSIDDQEGYSDNYINLSVGSEIQYTLKRFKRTRLYLLLGYYYEYGLTKYNDNVAPVDVEVTKDNSNNVGIGFGFEFLAYNNLSFSLDGGYHGSFSKELVKYENSKLIIRESNPIRFGFAMGISAFYNF